LGYAAGSSNQGSYNTLVGYLSSYGANLTNSTAIGAKAEVTQSNSLVLGSINGVNLATANSNVGIGTTAPAATLHLDLLESWRRGYFADRQHQLQRTAIFRWWHKRGHRLLRRSAVHQFCWQEYLPERNWWKRWYRDISS
jgi:hypothetical protein